MWRRLAAVALSAHIGIGTFDPLGGLFVVYNHNLTESPDGWEFASNQLLVTRQYTLRY